MAKSSSHHPTTVGSKQPSPLFAARVEQRRRSGSGTNEWLPSTSAETLHAVECQEADTNAPGISTDQSYHATSTKKATQKSSHPSPSTNAPLDTLAACFSRVELQFQLQEDRQKRAALFPRDLGNLLLWCVPIPISLIESPRIFFIKNKSKLRDVLVVYVNGISYDEMMCTGVGLPRNITAETKTGINTNQGTLGAKRDRTDMEDGREDPNAPPEHSPDVMVGDVERGRQWNEQLCATLLKPLRSEMCWAREPPGVQYCPLIVPSTRNVLEEDVFWRNDMPRLPGRTSSNPNSHHRAAQQETDENMLDIHKASPTTAQSRGVGTSFQKAKELSAVLSASPPTTTSATVEGSASSFPSSDVMCGACNGGGDVRLGKEDDACQHLSSLNESPLWKDRELLLKYALHISEHRGVLQELGFTLEVPQKPLQAEGGAMGDDNSCDEHAGMPDPEWTSFSLSPADGFPATGDHDVDGDAGICARPRIFALDCEMVLTSSLTSVLARATLVNVCTGEVVMDLLVKPRESVVNYLTRFSGIDEDMLADVLTTLQDCQQEMKRWITPDSFVVGHSLENDFKACKFIPNCYVLDTAWLYPHPSGLPYKNSLKFLAQRYLSKRIQQGAHDSAIDAETSAELVHLKLLKGPTFGIREKVSVLALIANSGSTTNDVQCANSEEKQEKDSHGRPQRDDGVARTGYLPLPPEIRLFDDAQVLQRLLPKASHTGLNGGRIDAIPVRHDEDATRKVVRALRLRADRRRSQATCGAGDIPAGDGLPFSIMWVQLTENRVDVLKPSSETPEDEAVAYEAAQLERATATNERVLRIIDAAPDETLVLVIAADCRGEESGNHFSRAHGACFGFIKDMQAPGPRNASESPVPSPEVEKTLAQLTPPVCQQQ